jgi:SWI/SNF-related matrix-associated actin-dependent regulator 1 of chromatin subfamily A
MKTVQINPKTRMLEIRFGGADFRQTLYQVKKLNGRSFDSNARLWNAPNSKENVDRLVSLGFSLIGEGWDERKEAKPTPKKKIDPTLLDERLYPYQLEGVQFLEATSGQGMVLDQMGLGKSCQAASWLKLHPEARPALIVCPASIKVKWQREIRMWAKEQSYIWPDGQHDRKGIFILNYDQLGKYEETQEESDFRDYQKEMKKEKGITVKWKPFPNAHGELSNFGFKAIIGDEIQYISNSVAQRSRYFIRVARQADHRIFLSGTPVRNRPKEFFNALNLLAPDVFPSQWAYQMSYCAPVATKWGWKFEGASNLDELHAKTSHLFIRHIKEDVLPELPSKRKMVIPLDLDDVLGREYFDADAEFMQWVSETKRKRLETQNKLAALRQLAYQAKRNSLFEWIDEWLEENPDEKIVLFGYHRRVLDDLESRYKDISARIDGSVSANGSERQERIDRFQEDPKVRVFIGQMIAAGTGIDLTAASTVAFAEMWWVPADMAQCEDRCHRLTSKGEYVDIYYLTAANTIEDDMAYAIIEKYKVVKKILDGTDNEQFFDDDFLEVVLRNRIEEKETA